MLKKIRIESYKSSHRENEIKACVENIYINCNFFYLEEYKKYFINVFINFSSM